MIRLVALGAASPIKWTLHETLSSSRRNLLPDSVDKADPESLAIAAGNKLTAYPLKQCTKIAECLTTSKLITTIKRYN